MLIYMEQIMPFSFFVLYIDEEPVVQSHLQIDL